MKNQLLHLFAVFVTLTFPYVQGTELDHSKLQWPQSGMILEGEEFIVYSKAYEPGVTDTPGNAHQITAWIGFNTTNDDPRGNSSWTWIPANYYSHEDSGTNYQYRADLGSIGLVPGIYYYAARFQLNDGSFTYGGNNLNPLSNEGGNWDGITFRNGTLTIQPKRVDFGNYQWPELGYVKLGNEYVVYGQVYEPGITPGAGQGVGITAQLGYSTVNNDPDLNPENWTWLNATYNDLGPSGNNDEYMFDIGSHLTTTGHYYMVFRYQLEGSAVWYYGGYSNAGGGQWNGSSNVSGELIVSEFAVGDYRTNPLLSVSSEIYFNSNAPIEGLIPWQTYNGISWVDATLPPQSLVTKPDYIFVISGGTTNIIAGGTYNNIIVENTSLYIAPDGELTIAEGKQIEIKQDGNFTIASNGKFELKDNASLFVGANSLLDVYSTNLRFKRSSTSHFIVENEGEVIVNNYLGNLWNGNESFADESIFRFTGWSKDVPLFLTESDITTHPLTGAKFGYLYFDFSTTSSLSGSGAWSNVFPNDTFNLTSQDFVINYEEDNGMNLNYGNMTLGRNFILNGNGTGKIQAQTADISLSSLTINGDLIKNGTVEYNQISSNGTSHLNINGNLWIHNGIFKTTHSTNSISNLNLSGNLFVGNNGNLLGQSSDNNQFNFVGMGDGVAPETTQTIDVVTSSGLQYITFNVQPGAYVKLINQNLTLGTNTAFNVKEDGIFDFGFSSSDEPLIITNSGSGQSFTAESGSTLKITSPDGLTTSASLGNVQIPVANRTFASDATYHYIGKTSQSTGNAIANTGTPLTGKIIVELDNPNLIFSASSSRTIDSPGTLEIRKGIVTDDSSQGFKGSGNLIMNSNDGRYITSRTEVQPELAGTYTLTAGTIEFANTSSSAKIRVTPQYHNIVISGNNIMPGGKNLVVNNLIEVIGTGKISFPQTEDDINPFVLLARKGIQVEPTGTALFGHNAQLMQDPDAINVGNIKMEKKFIFSPERQQYNFVNSPVEDQNIKDIYPGDPLAQYYDELTNKFFYYNGAYQAGRGVALSEPSIGDSITVAEFEGVPFNGTLTLEGLTGEKTGFHLMGNPYPSQLDLDEFYEQNIDVIEGRFLFWDNRGNTQITQYGDGYNGNHYAQYNASNSTGTAAATAVGTFKIPNGKLAVGSATMIRLQYGVTNTSVVLNNSQRTTGTSVNFFGKVATSTEKDRYWLTMDTPGGLSVMNAVVYFEGGNDAYGMDDNTSAGGSDDFYTMADSKKLAIQGKAPFEVSDTITVGYKAFEPGAYKINLHQFEGVFAENVRIYLIDQETQTSHNLSEGSYSFKSEAGEFQKRFLIVYQTEEIEEPEEPTEPEEPLSTVEFNPAGLAVYKHGKETVIASKELNLAGLQVYNLQGQLLWDKEDIHQKTYRLENNRFGKQTLILVVKTADGKEHNFKVLTH